MVRVVRETTAHVELSNGDIEVMRAILAKVMLPGGKDHPMEHLTGEEKGFARELHRELLP